MGSNKFRTLHEAIRHVLEKHGRAMTFEEIAIAIADIWRRPSDNTSPPSYQIKLRTVVQKKYRHLFHVDGSLVSLPE